MKLVVENEVLDINYPEVKVLPIQKFFEMAECPVQRDTEFRAQQKQYKEKFSRLKPEHCTGVSCELTEICYYDGKKYEKGQWFIIDAHTRRYFWMNQMTDIVPTSIHLIHYKCSSLEEVIELYQHHDESSSVEKGRDKLFGACKINDITINDPKLKGVMPYTHAAHYYDPLKYTKNSGFSTLELKEVVSDFKEQMIVLDKFVAEPSGGLKKKSGRKQAFDFHNAIIAAGLIALKAHGVTTKDADGHDLVRILKQINAGGKNTVSNLWDGATHIVNEFDGTGDILPKDGKGNVLFTYNEIKKAISFVLYWLEKALDDVPQMQIGKNWAIFIDGYYNRTCIDFSINTLLGIGEQK